ncbi:Protein ver-2 [Bienertia sinuspersici]
METLDVSWRGFKCRLKRDHYYPYDTYEKRLNSRPDKVPEDHFKLLLKYWASTPTKVTESIKSAVVANVQKELSAEREEIAKEKEAHAARVAEMERATKEQEMRDDLATQKEPMTLDVIASALAQLRQKDPSLTSEMIAKVIVASATSNSA